MKKGNPKKAKLKKKEEPKQEQIKPAPVHRPMILAGRTYKVATPVGEGFITINRDENGQPFEIFANIGKGGMHTMADAEALGRLISMTLRLAGDKRREVAEKIVDQLRGIGGSSHIGFGKDRVMSLADAIAKVLAEDLSQSSVSEPEVLPLGLTESPNGLHTNGLASKQQSLLQADLCPECGNSSFVMEEGCQKCYSCGYSKC